MRRWALFAFSLCAVALIVASCAQPIPVVSCNGTQTSCGSYCSDLTSDSDNCGTCGKACSSGQACVKGSCGAVCPGSDTLCGGDGGKTSCVNTQTDNANCGGCGKTCAAGEVCHAGGCSSACANGETKCTGDSGPEYCASLKTDNANCGACGKTCGAQQVCVAGICSNSCTSSQTLCAPEAGAPYCADLQSDNANCGACGAACSGTLMNCIAGGCSSECTSTQKLCTPDGGTPYCADTLSDNTNCGACGTVCPSSKPICIGGNCSNGSVRVLICGAPNTASWNTDIQTKLQATGAFAAVDVIACNSSTPTVSTLQGYQSVLVFSDVAFADATTLGNNLATYVSGGGYAVVATFANTSTIAIGGNWISQGYNLLSLAPQEEPSVSSALIIVDSSSPLVTGVSTLTATAAYRSTGTATNGGIVVAEWGDGKPLIIRGVKNGVNHVELNFYPPSSTARSDFWSGDGATILKNALLYR